MRCLQCDTDNIDNAHYCTACGCQLTVVDSRKIIYKDYAGFWRRVGAAIIDWILLAILSSICAIIVGATIGVAMITAHSQNIILGIIAVAGYYIFALVLNWLYFTLMESSNKQATIGKMALGIVVTDENGHPISFGRANIRYWSKIISSFILFIGYIIVAFTEKKQGLHDIIANTLVVEK